jgi:hypothetical protein
LTGCNLELSSAGTQCRGCGKERCTRYSQASADDKHAAALIFISVFRRLWEREAAEEIGRDCSFNHRAATLASGSDVTGAPASSSGATKL